MEQGAELLDAEAVGERFSSLRGESPSLLVGVIVSARKKAEVKEVLGSRRTYQFTLYSDGRV
jgi:hypothetical protein